MKARKVGRSGLAAALGTSLVMGCGELLRDASGTPAPQDAGAIADAGPAEGGVTISSEGSVEGSSSGPGGFRFEASAATFVPGSPSAVAVHHRPPGHPGVVVLSGSGAYVYEGNGFGQLQPGTTVSLGPGFQRIAVGDLGSEGTLDLAMASDTQVTVVPSSGAAAGVTTAIAGAQSLAIVPRSSRMELAVGTAERLTTYFGSGDVFQQSEAVQGCFGPVSWVGAADVTKDGVPEILAACMGNDSLQIYPDAAPWMPIASVVLSGMGAISAVALADVKGDAAGDLALLRTGLRQVTFLAGNGVGGFVLVEALRTTFQPTALGLEDLDRDGTVDLVLLDGEGATLHVYRGNGSFTFVEERALEVPGVVGFVLVDLDDDRRPEIVVAAKTAAGLTVYRNASR